MSKDFSQYYQENIPSSVPTGSTNPQTSIGDFSDYYDLTKDKVSPESNTLVTGSMVPGFEYDEARRLVRGSIDPVNMDLQRVYAQNQSGVEQFGAMLNQLIVGEIVGGSVEGVGYLFELGDVAKMVSGQEAELGNAISRAGESIREFTKETTPVYENYQPGQFRPDRWSWWMSNAPTVGSSLSLMIPAMGVTKGIAALGRGTKLAASLSAAEKVVAKGISSAIVSRHMEGMMEAKGVYDQTLDSLMASGIDPGTAQAEASKAAADTYKADWAMLTQDIVQYTTLTKPFGAATRDLTRRTAERLGRDVAPIMRNRAATIGKQAVLEAGEEGYQYIASEHARKLAEYRAGIRDKQSLGQTLADATKEGNFYTSMFFGAIGAGVMQVGSNRLAAARNRIRGAEDTDTQRVRNIDSWGQSIQDLASLNEVGESMGSGQFNTNNRQLADFGTRLAENGNLQWFLETANDLGNMSEEDQQRFDFTPPQLEEVENKFPNFRQDLQRIGELYENLINTRPELPSNIRNLAVVESFLTEKLQRDFNNKRSEFNNKKAQITELGMENVSSEVRDLFEKNELELRALESVMNTLQNSETSKEISDYFNSRVKELTEETEKLYNELSDKDKEVFNNISRESISYEEALQLAQDAVHLEAEALRALESRNKYISSENQEELADNQEAVDIQNLEDEIDNSTEVEDLNVIEDEAGAISPSFEEAARNRINELAAEQAQDYNEKVEEIEELVGEETPSILDEDIETNILDKYRNNPHLFKTEVEKILNLISNLDENYSEEARGLLGSFTNRAADSRYTRFQSWYNSEVNENTDPDVQKIKQQILDVINESIEQGKELSNTNQYNESITDNNTDSIADTEVMEEDIEESYTPTFTRFKQKIKEGMKDFILSYFVKGNRDRNFLAANMTEKLEPIEGLDQSGLDSGRYRVGQNVSLELRGDFVEIVAYRNGERNLLGVLAEGLVSKEYLEDIKSKLKSGQKITTKIVGFKYNFTKADRKTPLDALANSDIQAFSDISGSYVMGYVDNSGSDNFIGNPEAAGLMPDNFNNTNLGQIVIPVPFPHFPGTNLYIRGFVRTLDEYGKTNPVEMGNMINWMVNRLVARDEYSISDVKKLIVTSKRVGKNSSFQRLRYKNNEILLYNKKADPELVARIPIEYAAQSEELKTWLSDQIFNIDKKLLNKKNVRYLDLGYTTIEDVNYNEYMSNMITLTVDSGRYIENVQPLISYNTTEVSKVDTTVEEKSSTTKEADPSSNVENIQEVEETTTPNQPEEVPDAFEEEKTDLIPDINEFDNLPESDINIQTDFFDEQLNRNKNKPKTRAADNYTNYTRWNEKQELEWFNRNFTNVPVEVVENLRNVGAYGEELWGAFNNAAVYIAENAATGTAYHEAFHVVYNLFTTKSERDFLDKFGTEEELADQFMNYVQTEIENDSWTKQVSNFFRKLLLTIKSLFTNRINSLEEFFFRANNGFYRNSVVKPGTFGTDVLRTRIAGWTSRRAREATESISSAILLNILPEIRTKQTELSDKSDFELIRDIGIDKLFLAVAYKFRDYARDESLDEDTRKAFHEVLSKMWLPDKNTYGPLFNELIKHLDYYDGIKIGVENNKLTSHNVNENNAEEDAETLQDRDDRAEDVIEGWQFSYATRSSKNNAPAIVKRFIRYMQSPNKNFLGLDAYVNYEDTYNTLLLDLAGSTSLNDMVSYLESLVDIKPEYKQILDKLVVDPETDVSTDPVFAANFFNAFNKHHMKYNMVTSFPEYDNEGNVKGHKRVVMQANRREVTNKIIDDWREGIITNNELTSTDEEGNVTINEDFASKQVEAVNKEWDKVISNWSDNKPKSYYTPFVQELDKLGISIPEDTLVYLGKKGLSVLKGFMSSRYGSLDTILNQLSKGNNPFDLEADQSVTESKSIKRLAELVKVSTFSYSESSFRNLDNKTQYSHLEQNFLSKLVNDLQNPNNVDKVLNFYLQDPMFYRMSRNRKLFRNSILETIDNNKKDVSEVFDIQATIGVSDETGKTSYDKMSASQLQRYTLDNYYNNGNKNYSYYRGPVLSDAPISYMIKYGRKSETEVLELLADLAEAEYVRIQSIKEELNTLPDNKKIKNYHSEMNASTKTGYHIVTSLNGKNLVPGTTDYRTKVKNIIDKWLTEETSKYFDSLVANRIVVLEGNQLSNDSKLDIRILENKELNTEKGFKNWLKEFVYNDYLVRSEFSLLTVGDPAFYKSNSKNDNSRSIDYVKRAKEIHSPKTILDTTATFTTKSGETVKTGVSYNTIYLSDYEIPSPSYDSIKEALDTQLRNKLITKEQRDSILNNYNKVNQTDAQAYITLPFYRKTMIGLGRWNDKYQTAYNRLKKGLGTADDISLFQPMKPFMYGQAFSQEINKIIPTQNKNSEYLLLPQLTLVKDLNGEYINPVLANLYNFMLDNGIDSANFDSAVKTGLSKTIDSEKLDDLDYVRVLSDNISDHTHLLNMEDRGIQQEVPEHFLDSDNLFGTQIRKLISEDASEDLIDKINEYENLILEDLIESYSELENQIVTKRDKDGYITEINYKFLYELLLDEARSRGKGEEFETAIEWDKAKERFKIPLFNPTTNRSSQNLITSIFKNRITKQKIAGGAFVQASSFGLSKELELVFNEEGGLDHAQILLPAWSKEFFKDFVDENGNLGIDLLERDNPELLEMIGYRIPTEDKYSMLPLKVVGFLPTEAGGVVMLPADITTISGSDFDVDKMYIMMKQFRRDKQGNYSLVTNEQSSKGFRDNRKIELMMDILRHPNTLKSMLNPGNFDHLKDIAKDITNTIKGLKTDISSVMSLNTMDKLQIDNSTGKAMTGIAANENAFHAIAQRANLVLNSPVRFDNIEATVLGGSVALNNVRLNSKTGKLERVEDKNISQTITKNKAYYLAAIVDNAKDPVASYLNYNSYTSGMTGLLAEAGFDPATITYFMQQPIIRQITKEFFEEGADYRKEGEIINKYKEIFLLEDIKDKDFESVNLNTKSLYDNLNDNIDSDFQKEVFKSFMAYRKPAKDWTKLILSTTADTKGIGPMISNSEVTMYEINDILTDDTYSISGVETLLPLESDIAPKDTTKIPYGFTRYGLQKPLEIVSKIYPFNNPFFLEAKETISSNMSARNISATERENINSAIISYMMSNFDYFVPSERAELIRDLPRIFLEFKKKYPKFVENNRFLRTLIFRSKGSENSRGKRVPINTLEFINTGSLTNEQKSDIQQAWLDMFNDTENIEAVELANDLFKYAFYSTGLTFGPNSFSHLIPIELYTNNGIKDSKGTTLGDYMYNFIENQDNSDFDIFVDQYYRNNYNNQSLVPRVEKEDYRKLTTNGFTTDSKVSGSTLKSDKDGFIPYAAMMVDNKIKLYKLITNSENYAEYTEISKLGLPNYIQEYQRNVHNLTSVISENNIDSKRTAPQKVNYDSVTPVNELASYEIEGEVVKVTNATKISGESYTIEFNYNNKSYTIKLTKDSSGNLVYTNMNTGNNLDNNATLVKLFKRAMKDIYNKRCK